MILLHVYYYNFTSYVSVRGSYHITTVIKPDNTGLRTGRLFGNADVNFWLRSVKWTPIVPQRCYVLSIATWHEIWIESRSYENISFNYFALEKETQSPGPEQKWRDTLRSDGRFKCARTSQFFVTSST
jgi:hypothetical protein